MSRALMELHWLSVDKRIEYKLLLYTYKALHGLAPGRGGLRLLGAPGWNLERGPISNEEEGGKRIFGDYLRILFIPMWDIRPHILGLGPLNGGGPWL